MLRSVRLRANRIGPRGAGPLARGLALTTTLATLDLGDNLLGTAGVGRLALGPNPNPKPEPNAAAAGGAASPPSSPRRALALSPMRVGLSPVSMRARRRARFDDGAATDADLAGAGAGAGEAAAEAEAEAEAAAAASGLGADGGERGGGGGRRRRYPAAKLAWGEEGADASGLSRSASLLTMSAYISLYLPYISHISP